MNLNNVHITVGALETWPWLDVWITVRISTGKAAYTIYDWYRDDIWLYDVLYNGYKQKLTVDIWYIWWFMDIYTYYIMLYDAMYYIQFEYPLYICSICLVCGMTLKSSGLFLKKHVSKIVVRWCFPSYLPGAQLFGIFLEVAIWCYIYTCTPIYTYLSLSIYISICTYLSLSISIYLYISLSIYISIYTYL